MLSKLENFISQYGFDTSVLHNWGRVDGYQTIFEKYMDFLCFEIHLYKTIEYTVRNQSMAGIHLPLVYFATRSPTDMRDIHMAMRLICIVLYSVGSLYIPTKTEQ